MEKITKKRDTSSDDEELLLQVRRSWWAYFWHLLFAWLIVPYVIAAIRRACVVLKVYKNRLVIERGFLAKRYTEIFIQDIRTIEVRRSLRQRLTGRGDLMVATSGTEGYEATIDNVPDPIGIKNLLLKQRSALDDKGSEQQRLAD